MSDNTRHKEFLKKDGLLRLSADLAFLKHSYQVHAKQKWAKNLPHRP